MNVFALAAIALLFDRFVIDPERLWRRLSHPVVGFGWIISTWEERLKPNGAAMQMLSGTGLVVALVALSFVLGWLPLLLGNVIGGLTEVTIVAILLAQRSLDQHVLAVADGLDRSLEDGRHAVSMIVGRDPSVLDEGGVSRAAIESLAENFSDGVVAPLFWYFVLGLPGIVAYKAINTADSMIGHRTPRYIHFGKVAARVDDVLNWIPARFTALLLACLARSMTAARTAWRDARLHRSPNAGWPEAAMAGALDIALGGPRVYPGERVDEPFMNEAGRSALDRADIGRALLLYRRACSLLLCLVLLGALTSWLL